MTEVKKEKSKFFKRRDPSNQSKSSSHIPLQPTSITGINIQNFLEQNKMQNITELTHKLEALKKEYSDLETKMNEDKIQNKKESDELEEELRQRKLSDPIKDESNNIDLQKSILELQDELSRHKEDQQQLKIKLDALSGIRVNLANEIQCLPHKNALLELKQLIETLEQTTISTIESLSKQEEEAKSQITVLENEIESIDLDAQDLHNENNDLYSTHRELLQECHKLRVDVSALSMEIKYKEGVVPQSSYEKEVENLKNQRTDKLNKYQKEIDELLDQLKRNKQHYQDEIDEIQVNLKDLERKNEMYELQIEEMKKNWKEMKVQIKNTYKREEEAKKNSLLNRL